MISNDWWSEVDLICILNVIVSIVHTRGVWWGTKWGASCIDGGITNNITRHFAMVGETHA